MTEQGDTVANIIDFILGIASYPLDRRAVSSPNESGCAARIDPSPVIESLAMPRQWNAGADLADAYQSGCWQHGVQQNNRLSP